MPMASTCPECGYPLNGNEGQCPECGYTVRQPQGTIGANEVPNPPQTPVFVPNNCLQAVPANGGENKDRANYIYECSVIAWRVFVTKYATFTGRASRREFWSFCLIIFLISCVCGLALVTIIPAIAVCIRRLHDINRCGWWCCVPFACFFMYLKQSDKEENNYGEPFEANQYLN